MIKGFEDIQRLSQTGLDATMKSFGEWNRGWQAIAAEMTDYTKRSFEEGSATWEKLAGARSIEQAVEIQTDFARRSYEEYMSQMSKIGSMYADIAREAYKPVEQVFGNLR